MNRPHTKVTWKHQSPVSRTHTEEFPLLSGHFHALFQILTNTRTHTEVLLASERCLDRGLTPNAWDFCVGTVFGRFCRTHTEVLPIFTELLRKKRAIPDSYENLKGYGVSFLFSSRAKI